MFSRKSQITIFFIIGIMILVGIIVFFQIKSMGISNDLESKKAESAQMAKEMQSVNNAIHSCVSGSVDDALLTLGQNGGYAVLPNVSFTDEEFFQVPYYYYNGKDYSVALEEMEKSLNILINDNINFCMEDLVLSFEHMTYKDNGKKINVSIQGNNIVVNVKWDMIFNVGNSEAKVDDINIVIQDVKLKEIYTVYSEFMKEQVEDPQYICTSCLLALGEKYEIDYDMIRFDDGVVVFILTNKNMTIDGEPYEFIFANKYEKFSCDNMPPDADFYYMEDCMDQKLERNGLKLKMQEIKDIKAFVGDIVFFNVNASGLNMTYEDDSYLFDINNKTGLVKFEVMDYMVGNHSAKIIIYDDFGDMEYDYFNIEVLKRI